MNLGRLFMPYPEHRARLDNISSVQGNIILCEKLKTNLCGKVWNNLGTKLCHAVTLSRLNVSYVDGTPVLQKS